MTTGPICVACGRIMTPEDSKIHPEYFYHDACLPPELRQKHFVDTPNPWVPTTNLSELRCLGKLGEEAAELSSAICRCIIQGMNEAEPSTGKINRDWLEDEIADVLANIEITIKNLNLNNGKIFSRLNRKTEHLKNWHQICVDRERKEIEKIDLAEIAEMENQE